MNRRERRAAGRNPDKNPSGVTTPDALCEAALGNLKAGRYLDAQVCGQQALTANPDHAGALHLMGLLSLQTQHTDHAVEWLTRAVQQDSKPEYLSNLGTTLRHLGRHEEACKAFEEAVRRKPDDDALWKSLGNAQGHLGRPGEAVSSFQQVLRLKPDDWDAANKCGMLLDQSGRPGEALPYFDLCDKLHPNDAQTLHGRAMCLNELKRFEQALIDQKRAHALDPDNRENDNNTGVVLQSLDRDEEALGWFEKALVRQPDIVEVLVNKALSLGKIRRFQEAIATHQRAKAIDPDNAKAELGLGHIHLLMGNFEAGWAGHEARSQVRSVTVARYPQPQWFGEGSIEGKTILIHADEGLGDTVHFARYIPMVAARGARVILIVQSAAHALLSRLPGVAQCFAHGAATLPAFDLHCPICSLPLAFGTRLDTIPSSVSYLPSPAAYRVKAWEERLGPHNKPRIGLVWSGNPKHMNDHNRSMPLRLLSRILDIDAMFVSLQKDAKSEDKAILRERPDVIDLTADLTDFAETAALVSCLDLVISVDTSVAHLAAALGCPTWILLAYSPDWRWLLDRDDSPWYPTARLFRQDETRDYGVVLDRVRTELGMLIDANWQRGPKKSVGLTAAIPNALHQAGLGHLQAGRLEEAFANFQQALEIDPLCWEAACQSGILLYQSGRLEEAVAHFNVCDKLQPNHAPTLYMRAVFLRDLGRFEDALADNRRAHELDPDNAETCNNIGSILQLLDRHDEALRWFDRAIALRSNFADALVNKANTLSQIHRFDEAAATYDRARALDPENAGAEWNWALLRMLLGDFEAGWAGREARWKMPFVAAGYPNFSEPMWLGETSVENKTILLYADEGLGDSIQFARYVPMLVARGAKVIVVVEDAAYGLLSELPGVFRCFPKSAGTWPTFDLHCPLSSLPLAFRTRLDTIPSPVSYLPTPSAAHKKVWEDHFGSHTKLRVGIVWSGSPKHVNDRNRSLPLSTLLRILDVDATFVSLQKDPRPDDKTALREQSDIIDFTADLTDFVETAALVSCLDLVITVDTSVAHLAAALGRPTWILLPYLPDYRWLLGRDDSPWYPSVRLFRQDETRDYGVVFNRVRIELQALIDANWQRVPKKSVGQTAGIPDALHQAGLGHLQAGRLEEAFANFQQALKVDPHHWDAACQSGILLYQSGRLEEAVAHFNICDKVQPNHAPTLYMRAVFLRDLGRFEDALADNGRAHELDPDNAETCNNIGSIQQLLDRHDEAVRWFDRALALQPNFVGALYNKAVSLSKIGRLDEGFATYQHLKIIDRGNFVADWDLAVLLNGLGRFEEALVYLDLSNQQRPDHAPTLSMRARCLYHLKRFEECLIDNLRAYAIDPTDADICNSAGDALQLLRRYGEALPWFDRALVLRPNFVAALLNKAFSLRQFHRFRECFAIYDHVKSIAPENTIPDWNLAHLHLLTGNFESGWVMREARRTMPAFAARYPKFSQPIWLGEQAIEGKIILVQVDEGLGDTIQFARYIPMMAARGARVILVVESALRSLLSRLPGVSECLPTPAADSLLPFDMHCPLMSLPLAFGTRLDTIPAEIPYLPAPTDDRVQAWEARLGPHDKLRVGLVWSGNPKQMNDHNRSMPLRLLSRILDVDAIFVSLQKDTKSEDKAILRERPDIIDLTADLTDFAETAALVSCLDLVITVDTSVAHLAAALGRPTWILLAYLPDWRWLLDRGDSPWYPTARLFRQDETRDYGVVLDRVRTELQTLIADRRDHTPPFEELPLPTSKLAKTGAGALCETGFRHLRDGQYDDARSCAEQALAIDSGHADSLHLIGLSCLQARQLDQAVEWIAHAIRQDSRPEYLSSLAITLQHQDRFEEAAETFDKALQLKPDDVQLWTSLGSTLAILKRPTEAALSFQEALKIDPGHWDAANKFGILLYEGGWFEEALRYFSLCDQLQPNHGPTFHRRAVALHSLKRFEEALAESMRAHALDPLDADACNCIGASLKSLKREDDALQWFDRAIGLRSNFTDAFLNKANTLSQIHRFDEAVATFDRVKAFDPDNAGAIWNLALLQMLLGDFEAGWAGREARWKIPSVATVYSNFSKPMWLGQTSLENKTILLYADEGLGDSIQFARYIPMLVARGAKVIVVAEDAAYRLLSELPGVSQCFPKSAATWPAFDVHCPMSSLPLAFRTRLDTIPSEPSYLPRPAAARMQAWQDRLGPHTKLRVGLVWSGNPKHTNDHNRSFPLPTLFRILDVDATFVSLQKDPNPDDQAALRERTEILDLTADLTDFNETAALLCCLDLVVTVDTSVAHLAAALGRPTWILLPYLPDYRWLLDRDDSPWYPTARLFRQDETRDYAVVLDRVRDELRSLIASRRDRAVSSGELIAPTSRPVETKADRLCETGFRHLRAGQYRDARGRGEQALAIDPDHTDSLHLMGLVSLQAQQFDRAVACITQAIRHNPKSEYLSSLGMTLRQQGRHDEALNVYDKAVQLKPDDANLWKNLGDVLIDLKRPSDALLSFQHVLKLDPHHWDAAYRSGYLLHELGRSEEALPYLDLGHALRPDQSMILEIRAVALHHLKRFEESAAENRRALALNPDNADTCNNLAAALQLLGKDEEAIAWLDRAVKLRSNYVAALTNKASSLQQLHRFDEAAEIYHQIKAIDPENAEPDWNLALLRLLQGDFEAGWAGREARWKMPSNYPDLDEPMWLGSGDITGKTILIGPDEGLGDTLQFARYVPMLAARGARVILVVQDPLHRLMSDLPGVAQCISTSAKVFPPFDLHCPIMSLPLAFGTRLDSIPPPIPDWPWPATTRIEAWDRHLGPRDKLRVGLVWSGNAAHKNDHNRSIPLSMLSRILGVDARFISLQKDPKPDDKAALRERTDILDLTADLTDFSETAAARSRRQPLVSERAPVPSGRNPRLCRGARSGANRIADDDRSRRPRSLAPAGARCDPRPGGHPASERPVMCLEAQQYDRALEWIARAIRLDPKPSYLLSLGTALRHLGRREEALKAIDKAVQLRPDDAELWRNLGDTLVELERSQEALLAFQHVLKLDPRHWEAADASAFILCQSGQFEEALGYFNLCRGLRPNHAPTLAARAVALRGLRRNEEALADNRQAHALNPGNAETCNNLGDVLTQFSGRYEEALEWFDRALQLRPDYTIALRNKGFVLTQFHRFEQAIATYRHMMALDPCDFDAEWNLAITHMLTGNFAAGLPAREARWKMPPVIYPKLAQPIWLGGASIAGKTILIYADEGLGDSVQFARYVPMVAALEARIILVVQEPARSLLSGISGVSECLPKSIAVLPPFDVHCPICSLPLAFGTRLDTIPSGTSYLPRPSNARVRAWEDRLEHRLGPRNKLRIGLVWSGNPVHKNDHNRSLPLRTFSRLLDCNATFVSLQKNPRADDAAYLSERSDVIDLTADLVDFAETAALVSCLDLVITVDTSVAHLAAALECPTWILLPYVPDWRWLLNRDDSPWYPTARLFRQTETRAYGEVLERVHAKLLALISEKR